MYLISPKKNKYKANLHCHSTMSDGSLSPEMLKDIYKERGYSVLCISDHERPKSHSRLTDPDFLMLTGYEAYIRPDKNAAYDIYAPEVHLNLFARDPENETMICYNRPFCKYIPAAEQETLTKYGSERPREYTREYINEFISTAKEAGYIVSYNHPYWSMESEEDILATEGFFSMEMVNYNSFVANHLEHNGRLYDRLLLGGRRVFCHGVDDNHNRHPVGDPGCDSFGGFTVIMADSLSYGDIFSAMERGDMYSSMGPVFESVEVRDGEVTVKCSPVKSVILYTGSKNPVHLNAPAGERVTEARLHLDKNARFLRVSVVDEQGRFADTRGYSRDELGLGE